MRKVACRAGACRFRMLVNAVRGRSHGLGGDSVPGAGYKKRLPSLRDGCTSDLAITFIRFKVIAPSRLDLHNVVSELPYRAPLLLRRVRGCCEAPIWIRRRAASRWKGQRGPHLRYFRKHRRAATWPLTRRQAEPTTRSISTTPLTSASRARMPARYRT